MTYVLASGGSGSLANPTSYSVGGSLAAASAGIPYVQMMTCLSSAAGTTMPSMPVGALLFFPGSGCPAVGMPCCYVHVR